MDLGTNNSYIFLLTGGCGTCTLPSTASYAGLHPKLHCWPFFIITSISNFNCGKMKKFWTWKSVRMRIGIHIPLCIKKTTTDRNTILHANCFHPHHVKDNTPFVQFQRLPWICDFEAKLAQMERRFVQRGYRHNVVKQAKDHCKNLTSAEAERIEYIIRI